jgi:hypothetical protein
MNDFMPEGLLERIAGVRKTITRRALECGRDPETIRLVAVSKTVPVDIVRSALESGIQILGENYIQEARDKARDLENFSVAWHVIGHLQSNKAGMAVGLFDLIHTVDSMKTALELNRQAGKINKCQKILIQVNVARESTKSGVAPNRARTLVEEVSRLGHLSVKGLMTMPPYSKDPESSREYFKTLFELARALDQSGIAGVSMEELSMGTTGDFAVAVEEGATLVRVGTAIFGKRT